MVITIDGVCSYAVYYISGSNTCECKSGTCKCGEDTAGEYDVNCMCGINVVNPCEYKNWKSKNTYKKRREDKTDWTYTITEEMVEQTLSLLAEE
ncbi:MAG: hypothetical protein LUD72_04330 [Bacteroidales bacterium]|nr:hypothetical protein [Bacteroidales bacterium]